MHDESELLNSSDAFFPPTPSTAWMTHTWEADRKVRIKGAKTTSTSYLLAEVADRLNRGLQKSLAGSPLRRKPLARGP